ncbi:MAG: hypothetical protein J6A75_07095 [Lachnospiraceae bacterium]|nr:hypothetical protein [Lachnospiraceae bacterium]
MSAASAGVTALGTAAVQSYADYEQLVGGVETLFGAGGKTAQEYADSVGKSIGEVKDEYAGLLSAQRTVFNHANEAYKTAGMSANEYMETVTSFSASLIQSLGGDTEKAADAADQAIIDMSDNANKMGTSMEMIQNAYQGFAKQNYTMLDNLKLGYGGTKEEMARLIEDANKVKEANGEMATLSIESFADVTEAIHIIQTEMGITGTTAAEASSTISGSIGMMKASWENLVSGMADENADFDQLVSDFVDSVGTVAENLLPRVEVALQGAGALIEQLLPVIMEQVPDIIMDFLPKIIESGENIVSSLIEGAVLYAPQMVELAIQLLTMLGNALIENAPQIAEAVGEIVDTVLENIGELVPELQPVTDAIQSLADNFDSVLAVIVPLTAAFVAWKAAVAIASIIQTFTTAMNGMTLAQYAAKTAQDLLNASMLANPIVLIVTLIAALVAAITYLWNTNEDFRNFWINAWDEICTFFSDTWDKIVGFCTETIPNLISDIGTWFSELPEKIAYWLGYALAKVVKWAIELPIKANLAGQKFLKNIVKFFKELPDKVQEFLLKTLIEAAAFAIDFALKAKEAGNDFKEKITNALSELPGKLLQLGSDMVQGLIDGITKKTGDAVTAAKNMATSAFKGAKKAVDSNSPSKKFKWLGEMCVAGFDEPLEEYNPYTTLEKNMRAGKMVMNMNYVAATGTSGFDYARFGRETACALEKAGLTISFDKRTFGRITREVTV